MSELITTRRTDFRWQLLSTVSAATLILCAATASAAHASESDHPTVWIELGGQLERVGGGSDPFLPPFAMNPLPPTVLQSPTPDIYAPVSPAGAQKASLYDFGEEGKITFQPSGSNWNFSASLRYGRSSNTRDAHQQAFATSQYPNPLADLAYQLPTAILKVPLFADFQSKTTESHIILDFQAGRDVGVGSFLSNISVGVRAADFTSHSKIGMIARPDAGYYIQKAGTKKHPRYFHRPNHTDYIASAYDARSFHGVGPSVSWTGDVPVLGNENGALTLDWGVNAAVIFGRQKSKGAHHTSARYYKGLQTGTPPPGVYSVYDHPTRTHNRSHSVAVPNVGFLAGFSFRYPNAKVSFGYRADMFFGAMDMGIDQRDTKDRNFHGPFATISIGLGG